jgi:hypothetical protein
MHKLQSLRRRTVVLGVLAAGLLALVILRPAETSSVRKEDLPRLLAKFHDQVTSATSVEITRTPPPKDATQPETAAVPPAGKSVTLERKETGAWVLASAFDHPTRNGAVDRLLDALGNAKRQQQVTQREETFDKYEDPTGWIRVVVKDSGGKTLADVSIGKYGNYPEVYVLTDDGGTKRIVRAVDLDRQVASVENEDWIEPNLWPMLSQDSIARIDVEQKKDKRTLSFVKTSPEEAPKKEGEKPGEKQGEKPGEKPAQMWKMVSPKEGEARKDDVDDLVRSFTGLRVTDVVAGASTPDNEKTLGFDDPELVITATGTKPEKAGEAPKVYTLVVGKKTADDKGWNVRRQGESWTYTVSSNAIDPFRKDPDSFLPKPAEPAKPEGTEGTAPKDGEKKDGEKKDEGDKKEAPGGGEKKDDSATGSPDGPGK